MYVRSRGAKGLLSRSVAIDRSTYAEIRDELKVLLLAPSLKSPGPAKVVTFAWKLEKKVQSTDTLIILSKDLNERSRCIVRYLFIFNVIDSIIINDNEDVS